MPETPKTDEMVDLTDMEIDGVEDRAGERTGEGGNQSDAVDVCSNNSKTNTSGSESVIVPEVGYRFEVFAENEVEPYNQIEGIEWEVTYVKGQTLIAKPNWPETAVARWKERDFTHMFLLVCDFIKHYQ